MIFRFLFVLPLFKADQIEEGTEWNLDKNAGLYQGDILLSEKQHSELYGDSAPNRNLRPRRQIMKDSAWPDALVPFEYDDSTLTPTARYQFKQSMKYISERTCVKFEEDNRAADRVLFVLDSFCASFIGKHGGVQEVIMGTNCDLMGNALHELLHALGITHSMSRYDRDDYLNVNTDLMGGSDWVNFKLYTSEETYNAVPFEYGSVMTYSAREISEPKDKTYRETMGNRLITFYDMIALHSNYKCSCPQTANLDCKNGGVPNPATCSECFCPDGYGGKLCDDAPKMFSKKLMAEETWKNFTISFGFYGLVEKELKRATLFIEAPKNKTIQVQVTEIEGFTCYPGRCVFNGYEVKHMGDPRIMNPLFCCKDQPLWNNTYTSKLNPTPVILYTRYDRQTFTMRYRFVDEDLAKLPRRNNTYDSFEYPV